jgi:hypothetical protein
MGVSFKTPGGCLTSSWNKAVDAGKFQFRSGSKGTIMELDPAGGGLAVIVDDAFLNDPEIDRTTELDWLPGDSLIWVPAGSGCIKSNAYKGDDAAYYDNYPNRASVILEASVKEFIEYLHLACIVRSGVVARLTIATGECYLAYMEASEYQSDAHIKIVKRASGGALTVLSSSIAIAFADYYKIEWKLKFSLIGTTLKLKYWKSSDSEPANYQLETTDSDYATGHFGYYLYSWRVDGSYGTFVRIYDIKAIACGYASDSPLRFCEWDSGQANTVWADTLRIKHNVRVDDSGSIKVRVGYSNTQPSTLSEAECDALLGDLKTVAEAAAGGMSGTGRWCVAAFQFDSNGTQQTSVAIFDEGQTATVPDRVAVDVQASVSDVTPTLGSTLSVTGSVEATDAANVALTAEVRKKSDDSLVSTLFSNTVDLSAGSNDLPTLCGGSLSWDTTGADPVAYYVAVTVEDGTTDIIQDVVDRLFFEVVPPAAGRVDANLILSDPAPKVGDTITITGNIQSAENLSVNISIKVYKKDGDVLMATLLSGDKDLVIGANDINDLCGVLEWDTTPHAGEAYYIKVELSGIDPPEVEHMYFVSLPAGGKSFGRYKTV